MIEESKSRQILLGEDIYQLSWALSLSEEAINFKEMNQIEKPTEH